MPTTEDYTEGIGDIDGFRGRHECQLRPAFFIDTTYCSDKDLTGGNVADMVRRDP